MLQAIRSKASSLVVKLLFAALIVSFGIWGIGDIFRNRGADTTVATVGDRKIDTLALNQAVRQDAERWRQALRGAPLDAEQLKRLGVVYTALQRLINRDLIDLEIARLRLALSDEALNQLIRGNRNFQNERGEFDPNLYRQAVANQRMTPQQFEASLRSDLIRVQLNQAIVDGVSPPKELIDALFKSRAERRTAEVALLPPGAAPDPGAPNEAEVKEYYEQHQDEFRVPELRGFTVGLLLLDDVAAGIKVADDKLRDEYQGRIAEFHAPEERHFQQMLLPEEAKAKAAAAALGEGKDFAEVAKDLAGATPDTLDLGFFKKTDLPAALGEPAFALKPGDNTAPIQDTLGWHILHLVEVKPEETQSFDAVKEKLAQEVAREMAGDRIAKLANEIEDALAGGSSFADVAQRFALKLSKAENVDANGKDDAGKPVELPQANADLLKTAFSINAGQVSQLSELGENGHYLLQVDRVTPSAVKPLAEVEPQIAGLWQQQKREAALEQLAAEIAGKVNAGAKLGALAAERKLESFASPPLQRSGGDGKVPPALVASIFAAKPGTAVFAKGNDGYAVAQVKEVLPPDAKDEAAAAQFAERLLAPAMRDDLLQEFAGALRERYPVRIDEAAVARAF
jgi:peptidyl-prolyl cis-trans isomerase D